MPILPPLRTPMFVGIEENMTKCGFDLPDNYKMQRNVFVKPAYLKGFK